MAATLVAPYTCATLTSRHIVITTRRRDAYAEKYGVCSHQKRRMSSIVCWSKGSGYGIGVNNNEGGVVKEGSKQNHTDRQCQCEEFQNSNRQLHLGGVIEKLPIEAVHEACNLRDGGA